MGGRRPVETRVSCHIGERFWDLDYSRCYLFLKPQVNAGIQLIEMVTVPRDYRHLAEKYQANAEQRVSTLWELLILIYRKPVTQAKGGVTIIANTLGAPWKRKACCERQIDLWESPQPVEKLQGSCSLHASFLVTIK